MTKKRKETSSLIVSTDLLQRLIYLVRGAKVMSSSDLAELYKVEPRVLVQAVKRNIDRFPHDFMFQITGEDNEILKSQFVISRWGGARRAAPYAFTEQGVAMLSSVLRSARAIRVNIAIMRAFVGVRQVLAVHQDLARRIESLERKYRSQEQRLVDHAEVFTSLKRLLRTPAPVRPKGTIGFPAGKETRVLTATIR